ncbi:hypothetical protein ACWDDN_27310 [Streptomyces griseoruber]
MSARHRVRALRRHRIPRLREALGLADLALEQAEHEDGVRRRWATRDDRAVKVDGALLTRRSRAGTSSHSPPRMK